MIHFRPFRNSDPPALVKLWNQSVPEHSCVRPLLVHELDDHAFGSVFFDRAGLIVAERDSRPVGFVHAGFGPDQPVGEHPFALTPEMGVVAMVAAEPGPDAQATAESLIVEAERYLRSRGAQVLYGGGQFPLNPFYWGLYGGSEASGVPSSHTQFSSALSALGYEPISTTVHLHYDLDQEESRDPRAPLLRRQAAVEFIEDPVPSNWWENIALSDFHLTHVRLESRTEGVEIARAHTWDMTWFGRGDGRTRIGVYGVEVAPAHRGKGYGRFLLAEILRHARENNFERAEVQTLADNQLALTLYQSLGFEPVEQSTVFRLPAPFPDRSRPHETHRLD
ncbi:MAG: GNAT family N-acetyltransferase [Paludisphaera borealis]|uniref:GNAT family N-acetyltransferase n=1 Tax=Paludisphaera borealis TaxID=1387353 RepID=UPI00285227FF|nr:GNAT family N-acetyltransferase [Paludisphaera borealis]MDR3621295.1 GNAT family N-acetyltransferase [Paludisphaera borealis]